MKFSVIICTYMRPHSVIRLLDSLLLQTIMADEILLIDGSVNTETAQVVNPYYEKLPLSYHSVQPEERGLTLQRNVGVRLSSESSDVLVFLDDDVVLSEDFLKHLISCFTDSEVVGSDGLVTNECRWIPCEKQPKSNRYMFIDGYKLTLSARDRLRSYLGLFPKHIQPGITPLYGHGKSSLPPTGKSYEVDHLIGCMMAFRRSLFSQIKFSSYFIGYGLYEDYDFSVRAGKFGKLITNTAARLEHHHAPSGRPNTYKYGKMVVSNGWYVWRLKHPHPGMINIFKWHMITLLLMLFRLTNVISMNSETRRQALGDFAGRTVAWFKLIFIKPRPKL
jgi:GT2 family glycosyltransferase